MIDRRIRFSTHEQVRALFGMNDRNLRRLRETLKIDVVLRGDEVRLSGPADQVERGSKVVAEWQSIIEKKGFLPDNDVERVLYHPLKNHDTHEHPPVERQRTAPHARNGNGDESANGSIDVFHKARKVSPQGPGQQKYVEAMRAHDLVLCKGPAGSGKTYLAVAMAVNALRQEKVRKIVLVRPAVEAGEKLGFLPGDMFAKVNPYLRPLLDALADILDYDLVQRYLDRDIIEIAPLAFMRGRTLNNTFIIMDEAQNTTPTQMKMFLTRMGHHSKIVVTGDTTQTDLPEHVTSGLVDALERLRNVPGVAEVELGGADIVRHPLVRRIVDAYDNDGRAPRAPRSERLSGTAAQSVVESAAENTNQASAAADHSADAGTVHVSE